jgi:hypothetical protein
MYMGNGLVSTNHNNEFKSFYYNKKVTKAICYYEKFHRLILLSDNDPICNKTIVFNDACLYGKDNAAAILYNKYMSELIVTSEINFYVIYHCMKKLFKLFVDNYQNIHVRTIKLSDEDHRYSYKILFNINVIEYSSMFYTFEFPTQLKLIMTTTKDLDFLIKMSVKNRNNIKNLYINHREKFLKSVEEKNWNAIFLYLRIYLCDEIISFLLSIDIINLIKSSNDPELILKFDVLFNIKLTDSMYNYLLPYLLYD